MELKFRSPVSHNLVMINTDLYDFSIQEILNEGIGLVAIYVEGTENHWTIAKDKEKYKLERIFEIIEEAMKQGKKFLDLTKYTLMDE